MARSSVALNALSLLLILVIKLLSAPNEMVAS